MLNAGEHYKAQFLLRLSVQYLTASVVVTQLVCRGKTTLLV